MMIKKDAFIMLLISVIVFAAFAASAPEKSGLSSNFNDLKQTSTVKPRIENRVHRAGLFWVNVTNTGYFGNPNEFDDPCTGKNAISGELPGGSGTDFLFVGSLMFGGYLHDDDVDIDGESAKVFEGPLVSTGFEGWTGVDGPNDAPEELWPVNFVEDQTGADFGKIEEYSNVEGKISCLFEEVWDEFATAEEQFSTMYTDKYINRPYTGMCDYDQRNHTPLGIEVRQDSYAWSYEYAQKFVIIDYTLYNRNEDQADIYNFFMGVYLDCDIGDTEGTSPSGFDIEANHADDLGGFIQKWDNYIDPATGEVRSVDLNLAWAADNDGRNYRGDYEADDEPGSGRPLDGATSIATVRVLRNPNPNLRYAYNSYIADSGDESIDWGPRWRTGLHPRPEGDHPEPLDHERRDDPGARPWIYDLTLEQKGYDDYNQDNLKVNGNSPTGSLLYGGRTEGRPAGDKGRYMVMSNDEFDYDQTDIREVYLGLYDDPPNTESQYAQADNWQRWTTQETLGQPGYADNIIDGTIEKMNDLANGRDIKYMLSFGPLGNESFTNVAWDEDGNGEPDAILRNKDVWTFAHGDSLKLTLAFIVNDNFHTSMDQDPNYENIEEVNLDDGLNPDLWAKGWYDALYNVVWAERVFDMPMHDTRVKLRDGSEKSDGWYGEDVGVDGIFGDLVNDTYCWWMDAEYLGPDEGEGNFELDNFTEPVYHEDINFTAESEDTLLPYGRRTESEDGIYGTTRDYGYMVKYDKNDGLVPFGDWVRFGFNNNRMDVGDGVPDFTGPPPPPSPNIDITILDDDVVVEWQSHEFITTDDGLETYIGPEHFIDPFTRSKDFEGYQIQLSIDNTLPNYVETFSVDNKNYIYESVSEKGKYLSSPVSEKEYLELIAEGKVQIVEKGKIWQLVPFGDNRSIDQNHQKPGVYTYTVSDCQKDIMVSADSTETVQFKKYKFTLHNKTYLQRNYIAVTASDFGDPQSGTPPLQSNPMTNAESVIPTQMSFAEEIVVTPNPYRGDVDYEAVAYENIDGSEGTWSEYSRQIVFWNVPSRSVLRIYTLAGDLVKTIAYNANARVGEDYHYGKHGIEWDLINDNNQAVSSGIYLFSVQDVDSSFEHVGKFVIIK